MERIVLGEINLYMCRGKRGKSRKLKKRLRAKTGGGVEQDGRIDVKQSTEEKKAGRKSREQKIVQKKGEEDEEIWSVKGEK